MHVLVGHDFCSEWIQYPKVEIFFFRWKIGFSEKKPHFPRQYLEAIVQIIVKYLEKLIFSYWNGRWYRHQLQPVEHEMAMFVGCINRHRFSPLLRSKKKHRRLRNSMLDPYTCIVKKNRKYASECTEASHLRMGFVGVAVGSWGGFLRKIPFKESQQKGF